MALSDKAHDSGLWGDLEPMKGIIMKNTDKARYERARFQFGKIILLSTAASGFLLPSAAVAQSEPAATSGTAVPASGDPGDIVVTANRREQRIQNVPISVTAVTGDKLLNNAIQNPSDLQYVAPSLTAAPNATGGFQMRGIGSGSVDIGLEKPVAVFLDEVIQGIPRDAGFATFADVDRIELLRGPQGTLFGKNASAGVVSIITKRPRLGETEVIGHFRYGEGNEAYAEATVNIPLAANLAARITGVYQRRDGWLQNALTGKNSPGYKDYDFKPKLLWEPTSSLSVYVIGELTRHRDGGESGIYNEVIPGTFTGAANTQNSPAILSAVGINGGAQNERYAVSAPLFVHANSQSVSANVSWKLGDYTVTSVSAWKHFTYANSIDDDQSPSQYQDLDETNINARQITQELRLNSPIGGFVDYVAGLYYYNLRTDQVERHGGQLGRNPPPGTLYNSTSGDNVTHARSESYAAFAQANFHLTDKLTAIGGLRYTHDHVQSAYFLAPDPEYNLVSIGSIPAGGVAIQKANNVSGRATVQYQANRDLMFFATYARGYKGPAVGTTSGIISPLKPETVDDYEIGVKSQLFGRKLTLNVTAYTQRFNNFQTTTAFLLPTGVTTFRLANANGLKAQGIEGDARLKLAQGLYFNASMAYNVAKYKGLIAGCYANQPLFAAAQPFGCYLITGTATRASDLTDTPPPFAPKITGNVGVDYTAPLPGDKQLTFNALYTFRSKFISTAGNPRTFVDGYGLLNGDIGYGTRDGRWKVGIFARNLLDKYFPGRLLTVSNAPADALFQQSSVNARRTIGAKLDVAF